MTTVYSFFPVEDDYSESHSRQNELPIFAVRERVIAEHASVSLQRCGTPRFRAESYGQGRSPVDRRCAPPGQIAVEHPENEAGGFANLRLRMQASWGGGCHSGRSLPSLTSPKCVHYLGH